MSQFDKISDPTKIPGSAVFDITKLSDDELRYFINSQKNANARDASSLNQMSPSVVGMKKRGAEILANLEGDLARRTATSGAASSKQSIMDIFGGGGGGGGAYQPSDGTRERGALDDIYKTASGSGRRELDDIFAEERKRAINEAGVTGNLRTPGFTTETLGNIDSRRTRSLMDLISGLEGERAKGSLALEGDLADRGFRERQLGLQRSQSLASLIQGGDQFSQSFGLDKEKFGEENRRYTLSDIMDQQALEEATFIGRQESEAARRNEGLTQFAQITGGAGALLGGLGSFRGLAKNGVSSLAKSAATSAASGAGSAAISRLPSLVNMNNPNTLRSRSGFTPRSYR